VDDAFRFAAGARVTASIGMDVQLRRSLDFLLVADSARWISASALNRTVYLTRFFLGQQTPHLRTGHDRRHVHMR